MADPENLSHARPSSLHHAHVFVFLQMSFPIHVLSLRNSHAAYFVVVRSVDFLTHIVLIVWQIKVSVDATQAKHLKEQQALEMKEEKRNSITSVSVCVQCLARKVTNSE